MTNKNYSNEPFQRFLRKTHPQKKKNLIGLGGNKTAGFPNSSEPSFKRSKSAPSGFGALGENQGFSAIALIFNPDLDVLTVKRSAGKYWGADQWGAIGGHIENGETPEQAVIREIFEETQLKIDPKALKYECLLDGKTHLFSAYLNDSPEPQLNEEHTNWQWASFRQLENLNCVPNMLKIYEDVLGERLEKKEYDSNQVISFDFDQTLTKKRKEFEYPENGISSVEIGLNEKIASLVRSYSNQGNEVIITTSRFKTEENIQDIKEFVKHFQLPIKKVIFTNKNKKSSYLLQRGVDKHYDDDSEEIESILEDAPSISTVRVFPVDR